MSLRETLTIEAFGRLDGFQGRCADKERPLVHVTAKLVGCRFGPAGHTGNTLMTSVDVLLEVLHVMMSISFTTYVANKENSPTVDEDHRGLNSSV